MLLSGGRHCVPQSTCTCGTCEITISNARDLDLEFKDWLVRATSEPGSLRFFIKGFQAGAIPSGEKTLLELEVKCGTPLDPVLSAFQAKQDDLDVVIVCADRTFTSHVFFLKR